MHPLPTRASQALAAAAALSLVAAGGALLAAPLLLKAPSQEHASMTASGPATFVDVTTGRQITGTFVQHSSITTHTVLGRTVTSASVAAYDQTSVETFTSAAGTRELARTTVTQAFDRSTGAGRPGAVGDTLGTTAHVFKLPFHTRKQTYQVWDDTAGHAVPLRYQGQRDLHGLPVYVFTRDVAPTDLGELKLFKAIPGSFVGHPEVASIPAHEWYEETHTELYVEPVTGSLVGGVSSPHIWAQTTGRLGGLRADLLTVDGAAPDAASAAKLIASGKHARAQVLALLRAPWVLGGLAAVLLAGALVLGRRGRPAAPAPVGVSIPDPRREDAHVETHS